MELKEGPGRGKIALKGLRTHSWNVNNSPFKIRYISPPHTFLQLLCTIPAGGPIHTIQPTKKNQDGIERKFVPKWLQSANVFLECQQQSIYVNHEKL